jgi:hypothetical protein
MESDSSSETASDDWESLGRSIIDSLSSSGRLSGLVEADVVEWEFERRRERERERRPARIGTAMAGGCWRVGLEAMSARSRKEPGRQTGEKAATIWRRWQWAGEISTRQVADG